MQARASFATGERHLLVEKVHAIVFKRDDRSRLRTMQREQVELYYLCQECTGQFDIDVSCRVQFQVGTTYPLHPYLLFGSNSNLLLTLRNIYPVVYNDRVTGDAVLGAVFRYPELATWWACCAVRWTTRPTLTSWGDPNNTDPTKD